MKQAFNNRRLKFNPFITCCVQFQLQPKPNYQAFRFQAMCIDSGHAAMCRFRPCRHLLIQAMLLCVVKTKPNLNMWLNSDWSMILVLKLDPSVREVSVHNNQVFNPIFISNPPNTWSFPILLIPDHRKIVSYSILNMHSLIYQCNSTFTKL